METTPLLVAIAWAVILGGAGGLLTEIGAWYRDLNKPSWQPPDWLFGPAWTIILGLAGWAFYLSWTAADTQSDRLLIGALYAVNFVCHLLWSPLFFKFKRPDWALFEVVFLWLSVLSLCVFLRQYSVAASWMIVPYLVWVSFASILNWQIVKLNGPFKQEA
ncbi:TspO/MBR family protein [Pontixanthobacter aestiaquae]|uniref:Tryptophan-rich sensory protein n=2 Tax=Pontixanthobacter aestiaquae TaxID=1509367 RepID=A0A844Z9M0_9SPHN|nr:TspO/MBR family protein [Pontixanthobacter aestiaquae]MDN3645450.1 TspO/MBR family protein [Pontixanthobacter aestiaquae]MXO83550.1 tryptophan-rich sensory protein [Pontixanthobacter aestiaquae]